MLNSHFKNTFFLAQSAPSANRHCQQLGVTKLLQTPLWGNEGSSRSSIGVKRENKADVQESGTSSIEQQHEEGAADPSC